MASVQRVSEAGILIDPRVDAQHFSRGIYQWSTTVAGRDIGGVLNPPLVSTGRHQDRQEPARMIGQLPGCQHTAYGAVVGGKFNTVWMPNRKYLLQLIGRILVP